MYSSTRTRNFLSTSCKEEVERQMWAATCRALEDGERLDNVLVLHAAGDVELLLGALEPVLVADLGHLARG